MSDDLHMPAKGFLINGVRTTIALEQDFWLGLKGIADAERTNLRQLIEEISAQCEHVGHRTSNIRTYVLRHFMKLANAPTGQKVSEAISSNYGFSSPRSNILFPADETSGELRKCIECLHMLSARILRENTL